MKLIRFRKPSLKTLLGITKAEKQVKKNLALYEVTKIINAPKNLERRVKNKLGYYSAPLKILRNGLPKPGGCMVVIALLLAGSALLLIAAA